MNIRWNTRSIAVVLASLAFVAWVVITIDHRRQTMPPPDVQVDIRDGHGSAVHIGDGFFLTAGHVAKGHDEVTLTARDNTIRTGHALWISEAFDIALLSSSSDWVAEREVACAALTVGQEILGHGSPQDIGPTTVRGIVASVPRAIIPNWRVVNIVDMTILPGMSGGAVDSNGRVVGIIVGLSVSDFPDGPTGFGVIVPSSAICALLGLAQSDLPSVSTPIPASH